MKKSILISAAPGNISFEEKIKLIKDADFEAVELNMGKEGILTLESTESDVTKVKETVLNSGLEIASVLAGAFWQYPLTSGNSEIRKKGEDLLAKGLQICNWLGTDALLVVPGVVQADWAVSEIVGYDVAYQRSQESIKKVVPLAEELKVYICVENVWNKFLLSPLEMKKFVEELDSEYVKVYFDVGNVLINAFPEMWIRILGKLIKRIHLKDFKTSVGNITGFCNLLEGDVNWPEVIKALKETGYDSYLTAEISPYKFYPETQMYHTSLSIDKILGRK